MSYIDTRPYEFCGVIADIPLYHPLADYTDPSDFVATPANLVLGGGSGEHAGAVANILQCVYYFLGNYEFDMDAYDEEFKEDYKNGANLLEVLEISVEEFELTSDAVRRVSPEGGHVEAVDFRSWGSSTWVGLHERTQHSAWGKPFDPEETDLERWISEVIGEYALVNMQDVLAELAPVHAEALAAIGRAVAQRPIYVGVTTFPVGYQLMRGFTNTLGDGNVRR